MDLENKPNYNATIKHYKDIKDNFFCGAYTGYYFFGLGIFAIILCFAINEPIAGYVMIGTAALSLAVGIVFSILTKTIWDKKIRYYQALANSGVSVQSMEVSSPTSSTSEEKEKDPNVKYKYVSTMNVQKWPSIAIAVVGFVLGILCVVSSVAYLQQQEYGMLYLMTGIVYLITGLGMILYGVMLFVHLGKGNLEKMIGFSYAIGYGWCLVSSITCFFTAGIYGSYYGADLAVYIALYIVLGIIYIASAIFLLIASRKASQKNSPKIPGTIGSISLAAIAFTNFVSCLTVSPDAVTIITSLAVLFMAVLLVIISFKTTFTSKKVEVKAEEPVVDFTPVAPSSEPAQAPQSEPAKPLANEADRIKFLKEYKELLDNGVISQEEFDKKKNEIL